MTDQEMRRMVHHLAKLHGVSPEVMIETVAEGHEPEDHGPDGGLDHHVGAAGPRDMAGDGDKDEARRPWRRRRGAWVTLALVGAVFGVCIVFVLRFVNGSVEAGPDASTALNQAKASLSPSPSVSPSIKGLHIAFSYPQQFHDVRPVRDAKAGLESYLMDGTGVAVSQIAVSVTKLPSGQLDDDSGYKWRMGVSKDYDRDATTVTGEPAQITVKKDGTERTLYWPHGNMLVIVSVTSSSGGDLAGFLKTVQASLRWLG